MWEKLTLLGQHVKKILILNNETINYTLQRKLTVYISSKWALASSAGSVETNGVWEKSFSARTAPLALHELDI